MYLSNAQDSVWLFPNTSKFAKKTPPYVVFSTHFKASGSWWDQTRSFVFDRLPQNVYLNFVSKWTYLLFAGWEVRIVKNCDRGCSKDFVYVPECSKKHCLRSFQNFRKTYNFSFPKTNSFVRIRASCIIIHWLVWLSDRCDRVRVLIGVVSEFEL